MRSTRSRRIALTLAATLLLVAATAVSAGADAAPGSPSTLPHGRGFNNGRKSTAGPLVDHGGKVVAQSTTYAVWWGSATAFPADARSGIEQLLSGFGGSSYLQIAQQYMRNTPIGSTFGGSWVDPTPPPNHAPNTSELAAEVAKVIGARVPSPNDMYVVYTSNFPNIQYCAWHAAATINGVTVQLGYLPNSTNVAGCDPGDLYGANTLSEGTRSLADSTAHEFMEAITDALPGTAWVDQNKLEIGDKCNFNYAAAVTLSNGSKWQLQTEWSNAANGGAGGCVQGA